MPSDDRDPKFERALAQHLRGGPAQANCPDAETLAAYHERNLSLEEMAQWKQHISACEACQEVLALVETTENQLAEKWEERGIPVLEAASIPGAHAGNLAKRSARATASAVPQAAATPVEIRRSRRPALLRWAIPLGAVAAGVLVFIGLYEQRAPKVAHYADTVTARREEPAAPNPMPDQQTAEVQPQLEPKDERAPSPEMSQQRKEQGLRAVPPVKPEERAKAAADTARKSFDQIAGGRLEKKMPTPSASPKVPTGAATDTSVPENAPPVAAAPPPPAPLAVGGAVGGTAGGLPARVDAKRTAPLAKQKQEVTIESQAASLDKETNAMMMKQGAITESVEVTGADLGLILTPDNRVFWKLQPAGTVQLTTDGGKDWKSLETGANEDLTTGFAPSSNVCWIAGRSGTLLLTKDRGTHWSRINTPIAGDLGGVHAADAKHASIWDSARHTSYETSDGGSTWKQTTKE
jgi:Photosynthesis system II assembly factor YCF48